MTTTHPHSTWEQTKAKAKAARIAAGSTPEQEAERETRMAQRVEALRAEVRAYRLAEVRKERDLTQVEVAAAMDVGQGRVSAIERGDLGVTGLDVLRRYVEALGGKLNVVADFGDVQFRVG